MTAARHRHRTIADIGEFGFLAHLLPRLPLGEGTVVGPGQDCAVVRCGRGRWLITVDALVEGSHFHSGWMAPRQLGRKAVLVNASDIAAMGGQPRFCAVSIGLPPSYAVRDLDDIHCGIVAAARECGASVIGGNLTRARQLFISVTVIGEAPRRIVSRRGARPGDHVYVTGTLGDAAVGVRMLRAGGPPHGAGHCVRRFREPRVRLRAGRVLVQAGIASAMIDVSDGLLQDLDHICRESGVGAVVYADQLPRSRPYRTAMGGDPRLALDGGEDYELVCTVPARRLRDLDRVRGRLGCAITLIGEVVAGRGVRVSGADRGPADGDGFDHFRHR